MRLLIIRLCVVAVMLISAVVCVFADDAHSKTFLTTSKARVITPISIVNAGGQGLDFGMITLGVAESKVVVSAETPVPVNVSQGDAIVITSVTQTAAKFTVSGEAGLAYMITLPTSATLLSGANSLTINNFSCSIGSGGNIDLTGNSEFLVGGELTIPAGAIPGIYNGTFKVTVAYN